MNEEEGDDDEEDGDEDIFSSNFSQVTLDDIKPKQSDFFVNTDFLTDISTDMSSRYLTGEMTTSLTKYENDGLEKDIL